MRRLYKENMNSDEDYHKLVKLNMFIIILSFKKRRKDSIQEFISGFGMTPTARASDDFIMNILAQNFEFTEKSVTRLLNHFKEGNEDSPLILIQWIIDKLNEYIKELQQISIEAQPERPVVFSDC